MTGTEHVGRGAKGCMGCGRVLYADEPDYCPECMSINEQAAPKPEPKAKDKPKAEEPKPE